MRQLQYKWRTNARYDCPGAQHVCIPAYSRRGECQEMGMLMRALFDIPKARVGDKHDAPLDPAVSHQQKTKRSELHALGYVPEGWKAWENCDGLAAQAGLGSLLTTK